VGNVCLRHANRTSGTNQAKSCVFALRMIGGNCGIAWAFLRKAHTEIDTALCHSIAYIPVRNQDQALTKFTTKGLRRRACQQTHFGTTTLPCQPTVRRRAGVQSRLVSAARKRLHRRVDGPTAWSRSVGRDGQQACRITSTHLVDGSVAVRPHCFHRGAVDCGQIVRWHDVAGWRDAMQACLLIADSLKGGCCESSKQAGKLIHRLVDAEVQVSVTSSPLSHNSRKESIGLAERQATQRLLRKKWSLVKYSMRNVFLTESVRCKMANSHGTNTRPNVCFTPDSLAKLARSGCDRV
jgi:hypothetical protein